jgi:two-component system, cell cycle response regulator CpdR
MLSIDALLTNARGSSARGLSIHAKVDVVSKTVLVIDDEDLYRDRLGDYLGGEGVEVLEANSAAAGVEFLREGHHVDLVLLDGTPGGDRRKAFLDIQAERPGLPVIVMSGESWEGLKEHFRGLPVGYLAKPFSIGRVVELLDAVF